MNRKLIAIGISCVAGAAMLVTTAFASVNGGAGYDAYKTAVKTTLAAKNFTASAQVNIKDNGNDLLSADLSEKRDSANGLSSQKISVTAGGKTVTTEAYNQDGQSITKNSDSDVYYVIPSKPEMIKKMTAEAGKPGQGVIIEKAEGVNPEKMKSAERILDALVGNLQDYVMLDNKSDGSKALSVDLAGNQIPAIVNALVSAAVPMRLTAGNIERKMPVGMPVGVGASEKSLESSILGQMPKLTSDINIDKVSLKADVNKDNYIQGHLIDITLSGKDANGTAHSIDINIKISLSDFNATTPDKVDLTGKNVKTVEMKKFIMDKANVFHGGEPAKEAND